MRYSSDLNYPVHNNELAAAEDVNLFKIGLEKQPTYSDPDSENEDNYFGKEIFFLIVKHCMVNDKD